MSETISPFKRGIIDHPSFRRIRAGEYTGDCMEFADIDIPLRPVSAIERARNLYAVLIDPDKEVDRPEIAAILSLVIRQMSADAEACKDDVRKALYTRPPNGR